MAEQLFQIGIKALVRNDEGKILMVHVRAWGDNPDYWDFPGGRMDPGEGFLDTLKRELMEEIGVPYAGTPKQLAALKTNITIPVGDVRYPLVMVVYETELPQNAEIKLDPDSAELDYGWFDPGDAADKMGIKFPADFCEIVRNLK